MQNQFLTDWGVIVGGCDGFGSMKMNVQVWWLDRHLHNSCNPSLSQNHLLKYKTHLNRQYLYKSVLMSPVCKEGLQKEYARIVFVSSWIAAAT